MAAEGGSQAGPLIARLREDPCRFDFFQLLRALECAFPDRPRWGTSKNPGEDPIRLCQEPSLAFASSTIANLEEYPPEEDKPPKPPRLAVRFLGLLGPNGPLPLHLTQYVLERIGRQKPDRSLLRFLDMFHHRILSLFYRAWAVNQIAVSNDRPDDDRFGAYLGSLIGIGTPSFAGRDHVPDAAKIYYSGRLSAASRNAEGLAAILGDDFGVPVEVEPFIGRWMDIPDEWRCRLGRAPSSALGSTALLGGRQWECQQKFRIHIGPIDLRQYETLLPGGDRLPRLADWVRTYIGDELMWDVRIIIRRAEIPGIQLGVRGKLGWTTWLVSVPIERDRDDLVLDLMSGKRSE